MKDFLLKWLVTIFMLTVCFCVTVYVAAGALMIGGVLWTLRGLT